MAKEKQLENANSKIEAIKELIFGENMQEYDSEFDKLKKDIVTKRDELRNFIEDTRQELMTSIDNLSTDVNIRITDLENALEDKVDQLNQQKVDRDTLGSLLINLGEKIKG